MVEQNAFELGSLTGWKLVGAPLSDDVELNYCNKIFFSSAA